MECLYCKGKMEKGKTAYTVNRKGYHLVIDQVPAYICRQCGEPYFEEAGVKLVQELLRDIDRNADSMRAAI